MSQAGDVAQFTTLALLVFHPAGSGLGVSGAAAAETAPVLLFAPVASPLVDRLPRVEVMIGAALAGLVLAAALALWHSDTIVVYAGAFGLSAGSVYASLAVNCRFLSTTTSWWRQAAASGRPQRDAAARPGCAGGTPSSPREHLGSGPGGHRSARTGPASACARRGQALAALSAGATSALLVVLAADHLGVTGAGCGAMLAAIAVGPFGGPLLLTRLPEQARCPAGGLRGACPARARRRRRCDRDGPARDARRPRPVRNRHLDRQRHIVSVVQSRVQAGLRGRVFASSVLISQSMRLISLLLGGALADSLGIQPVYYIGGVLLPAAGPPASRRRADEAIAPVSARTGRRQQGIHCHAACTAGGVWYAVLDLEDGHVDAELVPLDYDWRAQAASMRDAGLPEAFVETIETGWWTTCLEVLPPRERSTGRFHLYRSSLPDFSPTGGAERWDPAPTPAEEDLPVVPLFGTPYFPSRLWVYTNFHCNLACDYCAVASSPKARARSLTLERFRALVADAVGEGFTELYLTGGEPLLHPDITAMLHEAVEHLPTIVMTNAMLLHGVRLERLRNLAGHQNLLLQTSLDGARSGTHDLHRGRGSWARTVDGIRRAVAMGIPVRVALKQTAENEAEIPVVVELLAGLGVPAEAFAVRPMLRRGLSVLGVEIGPGSTVPELTVTAEGLHWHPAGADLGTSPDMLLATGEVPLAIGKQLATERFFAARLADGSLPQPYRCAI